jgi:hypothetical protein
MKSFTLFTLISLLCSNAFAGVFREDTVLPVELRERILAAVSAKCLSPLFELKEESTLVEERQIDQGQIDYYYRTHFSAYYSHDGMHPSGADIVVESAEYWIHNPSVDRYEVLSVKSPSVCE